MRNTKCFNTAYISSSVQAQAKQYSENPNPIESLATNGHATDRVSDHSLAQGISASRTSSFNSDHFTQVCPSPVPDLSNQTNSLTIIDCNFDAEYVATLSQEEKVQFDKAKQELTAGISPTSKKLLRLYFGPNFSIFLTKISQEGIGILNSRELQSLCFALGVNNAERHPTNGNLQNPASSRSFLVQLIQKQLVHVGSAFKDSESNFAYRNPIRGSYSIECTGCHISTNPSCNPMYQCFTGCGRPIHALCAGFRWRPRREIMSECYLCHHCALVRLIATLCRGAFFMQSIVTPKPAESFSSISNGNVAQEPVNDPALLNKMKDLVATNRRLVIENLQLKQNVNDKPVVKSNKVDETVSKIEFKALQSEKSILTAKNGVLSSTIEKLESDNKRLKLTLDSVSDAEVKYEKASNVLQQLLTLSQSCTMNTTTPTLPPSQILFPVQESLPIPIEAPRPTSPPIPATISQYTKKRKLSIMAPVPIKEPAIPKEELITDLQAYLWRGISSTSNSSSALAPRFYTETHSDGEVSLFCGMNQTNVLVSRHKDVAGAKRHMRKLMDRTVR